MKKMIPVLCLAVLSACTTPADVSKPLAAGGDKNAKFSRAFVEAVWKEG